MEVDDNITFASNALIQMDDQDILQIFCLTLHAKPAIVEHVIRFAQQLASGEIAAAAAQQQQVASGELAVAVQQQQVQQALVQQSVVPPGVTGVVVQPPSGFIGEAVNANAERMVGVVKSFNVSSGFGFIVCPETHAKYGRDVFLGRLQQNGFEAGNLVSFIVQVNERGHPQAFNLEAAPYEAAGPELQELLQGLNKVPQLVKPRPREERQAAVESDPNNLGVCIGVVKSFNSAKGFGFIHCPNLRNMGYQNDVFIHASQLGGQVDVGISVQFNAYVNPQSGKLQCKDVVVVEGAPTEIFFEDQSGESAPKARKVEPPTVVPPRLVPPRKVAPPVAT